MKLIFNKIFNKKTLIVFMIVMIIFNTIIPSYSYGFDFGGVVFKPFNTLIITIIDGVNGLLAIFFGGLSALSEFDVSDNAISEMTASPGYIFAGDAISKMLASPEYIFAGKYPLLNANLFSSKTIDVSSGSGLLSTATLNNAVNGTGTATIGYLRGAVAGVYGLLLNICAIVLLCLLIYTGIRIVLSAGIPQEQSKWKAYLIDWFKALGLLVFMHLLMIAIFNVTDLLANALAESLTGDKSISGMLRDQAQSSWDFVQQVMATSMYGYATYLTVVFAFAYFKRVIWTSILIVIAPIVAALYAFGGQGKEIYKKWFKEFLVNCFIQPFHVIVFYILIIVPVMVADGHASSGWNINILENSFNMIYCLIAMSMIRPAEKYIKDLFGMNGKIANTASFESGKQVADSISNAIKHTIMTGLTLGSAVFTGGATVAASKGLQVANQGVNAINQAKILGNVAEAAGNGATVGKQIANGGAGTSNSFVPENMSVSENNGSRVLTFGNNNTQQNDTQQNGVSQDDNKNVRPLSSIYGHQGSSLRDRILSPNNLEQFKGIYDGVSHWKHSIGDVGRAFGNLEGGGGQPPVKLTPFLIDHMIKKSDEDAKRFASDGSTIQYFKDTRDYESIYKERNTKRYKDENGKLVVEVDTEKLKEDINEAAKRDAEKASQYFRYGYNNIEEIDRMMQIGKAAGYSRPEDVVPYIANYSVAQQEMIKSGAVVNGRVVTEFNIDDSDVREAIKDRLSYLESGQNLVGANLKRLARENKEDRQSFKNLDEFAKLGQELKNSNIRLSYDKRGDVKTIYQLIESGKKSGMTDINNMKNSDKLPENVKTFINTKLNNNS